MSYSIFLVPALLLIGSTIIWWHFRDWASLLMVIGFSVVIAVTAYTWFTPPPFDIESGQIISESRYQMAMWLGTLSSIASLLSGASFVVFSIRAGRYAKSAS